MGVSHNLFSPSFLSISLFLNLFILNGFKFGLSLHLLEKKWRNYTSAPKQEAEFLLPSGGVHSWTADTEFWYIDFMHALDASKAKIPNALPLTMADIIELMTDPAAALEAENKWGYMSYEVLVEMFILEGLSPEEAIAMASMWPEGMYIRFVNVGK